MPIKTEAERAEEARKTYLKKMRTAFETFDQGNNGTCDVREVGTIVRSLGVYCTEQKLLEIIKQMEDPEPTGFVQFNKFTTVMTEVLESNRYQRDDEETIYRAFLTLDTDKKGYLTPEELKTYMTSEGEPFSNEEMEEMLSACLEPKEGKIYYEDYVTILAQ